MKNVYQRFSKGRIIEHWVYTSIFSILVISGLSQTYFTFDILRWFIQLVGGIDAIRLLHRYAGFGLSLATVVHIAVAVHGIIVKRWQPSMVITQNDIQSAVHNIKYYLGNLPHPAEGGRYNYTQKFEYWGILTGAILMILTGAVLWKPLFFTPFISGEIIPLSKVMHMNGALVVFLIVALWHTYNSIFSPEVFPLNTSIFTGRISRNRMVHDHILELAALENTTPENIRAHYHDAEMQNTDAADLEIEACTELKN